MVALEKECRLFRVPRRTAFIAPLRQSLKGLDSCRVRRRVVNYETRAAGLELAEGNMAAKYTISAASSTEAKAKSTGWKGNKRAGGEDSDSISLLMMMAMMVSGRRAKSHALFCTVSCLNE